MRLLSIILVLILFGLSAKSQSNPSGFPTQKNLGWQEWGWQQSDSGTIIANRLPNFTPRYPGTTILHQNNGTDTTLKFWTGQRWLQLALQNSIVPNTNISNSSLTWDADYIQNVNNKNLWFDSVNFGLIASRGTLSGRKVLTSFVLDADDGSTTPFRLFHGVTKVNSLPFSNDSITLLTRYFANQIDLIATNLTVNNRNGKLTVSQDGSVGMTSTGGNPLNTTAVIVDTGAVRIKGPIIASTRDSIFASGDYDPVTKTRPVYLIPKPITGDGTVASIGLSMPSAFTVSDPNPITTSGTFTVSGAGTSLQYIRGNGTLGTFDTAAIPSFSAKVRSLFSETAPITYNQSTGAFGISDATTVSKGAASFNASNFSVSSGAVTLADVVASGSCTNCDLDVNAKGQITGFSNGTGGATNNTNIGSGYRWLVPSSQGIKTAFVNNTLTIDSTSNTNGLTFKVDTSIIATFYDVLYNSPEFYKPENYGAVRDGVTDDAAAFQAMFDDIPATGGTILLQAGTYLINDSIIISNPFKLFGSGYKSVIKTTNGAINLFVIRTTNYGHLIQDVQFLNASVSTPVSGSAIWTTGDGSGNYNQFARYENVYFDGFWNDVVNDLGSLFVFNKCIFDNPVNYGLLLRNIFNPDSGDGMISDCYFNGHASLNTEACIQYESSGGVKMVNNKFNANSTSFRPKYLINLAMNGQTSDMLICNNSMENFGITAIKGRLINSSVDLFRDITITGNQITPWFGNSGSYIDIEKIEGIAITGNTFRKPVGATDVAIELDSCENVTLLNNFVDFTTLNPVTVTNSTNIRNYNDLALHWNNNGVAIGGSDPTNGVDLHIKNTTTSAEFWVTSASDYTGFVLGQNTVSNGSYAFMRRNDNSAGVEPGTFFISNSQKKIVLSTDVPLGVFRQDLNIFSNGHVTINSSTDGGETFQVNGSMGLDLGSDATGDIYYRNSGGSFTRRAIGSTDDVLTVSGGLPVWSPPNYASGTYTPTLTNGTNVSASTAYQCQYMRVGNVVTVSGKVDIDPTASTTTTLLEISLPISSAVPNDFECAGVGACGAVSDLHGAIRANTVNDTAELIFTTVTTVTNQSWFFTFTYLIDNS